jgi:hypothetical protein
MYPRFSTRILAFCVTLLSSLQGATTPTTPGGPTVTVNQPVAVTVSGPVEVQGTVEVLNDALKTPFHATQQTSLNAGIENAVISFPPLPAGKRLIIEVITVRATVPLGQNVAARLVLFPVPNSPNPSVQIADLAVQPQGTFTAWNNPFPGNDYGSVYVATHTARFRVDAGRHSVVIDVRRSGPGTASMVASVFGYLEDIPPVSP